MAQQVLFIHSAGPQGDGQGSTGLLQYLEDELAPDYQVIAPRMPDPEDPQYEKWKKIMKEEIAALEDGAVLVGHSIGGSALFKFLSEEQEEKPFSKLIAIAAPFWGIDGTWQLEDFQLAADLPSRAPLLPPVVLFHSIGDEIVPFAHMKKYMESLPGATARQLPGNDHIFQQGCAEVAEEIRKS